MTNGPISMDDLNSYQIPNCPESRNKTSFTNGVNAFSGNVIDFMITPTFIENNFDKFVDFIMLSTNTKYFQMQIKTFL